MLTMRDQPVTNKGKPGCWEEATMKAKIAIIGYGSMGKMLLEKIIGAKIIPENHIYVSNRTIEKIKILKERYNIHICDTNVEAAKNTDLIFLCIRPTDIKTVLEEILTIINKKTHIISLNGSIRFEQLEKIATENKISKVIPSVTAEINESQTLVCHNKKVTEKDKKPLMKILKSFGDIIELPEEEMGMGAELVSCMPGFIAALFNEIKKEAQKRTTITEHQIIAMLAHTMVGTGRLILEKNMTFEAVIERVATKGGITEEGTKIIERDFPEIAKNIFNRTLEKRKIIAGNIEKSL